MPDSLLPIEICQQAVGEHVKQIAAELNLSDKRIYQFLGDESHDPYTRFVALFKATAKVNPDGFELFYRDIKARYEAERGLGNVSRDPVLAEVLEALTAILRGEDTDAHLARAARGIDSLMAMRRDVGDVSGGGKRTSGTFQRTNKESDR